MQTWAWDPRIASKHYFKRSNIALSVATVVEDTTDFALLVFLVIQATSIYTPQGDIHTSR